MFMLFQRHPTTYSLQIAHDSPKWISLCRRTLSTDLKLPSEIKLMSLFRFPRGTMVASKILGVIFSVTKDLGILIDFTESTDSGNGLSENLTLDSHRPQL